MVQFGPLKAAFADFGQKGKKAKSIASRFLCLQRHNICGFVEQGLKMRSCFFVTVNVAIRR